MSMTQSFNIEKYWENRYARGKNSGSGSYGRLAEFKADYLNQFVSRNGIKSVIEFGCGDGNQLTLSRYPNYLGFDVSNTAVVKCRELFHSDASKQFRHMSEYRGERAELSMSLDVIFHLVVDEELDAYMRRLFDAGERFVIIYSSNDPELFDINEHVLHRRFTDWTGRFSGARLVEKVSNPYPKSRQLEEGLDNGHYSPCDFYVFEKRSDPLGFSRSPSER
jgi:hypothetical protein